MSDIKIGDRVRVKDHKSWPFHPKYKLAGSEGIVIKLWESKDIMEEFHEYVYVRIEETDAEEYEGTASIFRVETLDKM